MKPLKLTPLALVASLMVTNVHAQISPPSDYGQKIGDVTVSASLVGTELKKMTQNTTILTKEDVDSFSEQTIDQVLKNQSSVFLNDQPYYEKDPTGQSLNVRGLGNARTLFLIDGVPSNDAMYGTIQWNRVPLTSVEDVELIRGGVSNLYGNMGMGGVLNITTKPISENKGDVSANYGSFNTSNVAASKEFAVNNVLRLRASADYFHTDGWMQYPNISPAKPATYIKGPMGPEYAESRNFRLQGELRISADTTGFFNLGSHQMSNPPTGGYSFATKTTNETTFSAGINTKLSADQVVQANAFYENTTLWQQNTPTIGTNPTYINANYMDPSNTFGLGAKYIQSFKEQPIDQIMLGIDGREVAAQNLTNSFGYVVPNAAGGPITSSDYASGNQNFMG
jgi:iron complex outermembrane receptor protein